MSTVTLRLLPAMLPLCLTACAGFSKKPTPPLPPRVDCEQAATPVAPKSPTCSPAECGQAWIEHAVRLTYGWAEERKLRGVEHQCVRALKDKGVIR